MCYYTLPYVKRVMNSLVPLIRVKRRQSVDGAVSVGNSARVTLNSDSDKPDTTGPVIRRPIVFYITVIAAFSLLGAAVVALVL